MGLTIDQWDNLDDYQRAHILGPDIIDAEREAAKCPACGGKSGECQDTDNQHAFVVTLRRCYRTRAVQDAMKARSKDPDAGSLLVSVTLDPTRKKSATKKGASRG